MLNRYLAGSLMAVLILICTSMAQTNREAQDRYERGRHRYLKGDIDGAIADFTKAISLSSRPADEHRRPDTRKLDLGFEKREQDFPAVTLLDPLTARIYVDLCLARYSRGDFQGAILDCDRAIDIDPGLGTAYLNRGTARSAAGDLDGALGDFEHAIAIDSRDSEAYNNRAAVLYRRVTWNEPSPTMTGR